ncbi:Stf0 family sulfotransferase [Microlunatus flavus]|nr:Stf0 family sulfotransferase [Microlunatus flavus]
MARPQLDSWLLCATPRSGSTLLCGLLESSGVAGRPASYFNRRGLHDYSTSWQVSEGAGGRISAAYVRAARTAGSTPNGVFGGRLMAESRPELIADLTTEDDRPAPSDLELLRLHFGRIRFVHLRRLDVVAQAVSWAKSLQTHFWHPGEQVEPGAEAPHYDEELLGRLVETVEQFEAGWNRWFTEQRITPFEVTYEQLAADPLFVAHEVLDFLDLELDEGRRLVVRDRQQADHVNARWIETFKSRS